MVEVSIVRCNSYNEQEIYNAIKKSLNDINFEIKPKIKVLIKPNVLAGNNPKKATVTHPAFVGAICRILKEKNCDISIGDSSAYYENGFTRGNFRKIGLDKIAEKYGARLIAFEEEDVVKAKHQSKIVKELFITSLYNKFDLIISAPKLKVHSLAKITGAVKNLYGMVPGGCKQLNHDKIGSNEGYKFALGQLINDVYLNIKPELSLLDGIVGLERDGPASTGEPKKVWVIMASKNAIALDYVIVKMIHENPDSVYTLIDAEKRKLIDFKKIKIIGKIPDTDFKKLEIKKKSSKIGKSISNKVWNELYVYPYVKHSKCNLCKICIKKCPVKSISIKNKKYPLQKIVGYFLSLKLGNNCHTKMQSTTPSLSNKKIYFDRKKCVYCYGCEHYCPKKAIYMKGSLLNKLLRFLRKIKDL